MELFYLSVEKGKMGLEKMSQTFFPRLKKYAIS